MKTILTELITRDLNKLISELQQYSNEADIWLVDKEIKNSAGTLTLHLIGNLNYYLGSILNNTGYVRDREAEFNDRNIPLEELLSALEKTKDVVANALANLTDEVLHSEYPLEVFGEPIQTSKFLIHLQGHLNYHLGQVNYHRRLLAHSQ